MKVVPKPLAISYSANKSWLTCQQQYWYRYVDRLKPKVAGAPLELGSFIHDYLEWFYRIGLRQDFVSSPELALKSHKRALRHMREKDAEIELLAKVASGLGQDDDAHALLAIPQTARDIMRAYFRVHGAKDLDTHRIVMVEDEIELPVKDGVVLPGRIDMVTKNPDGFWLWEHKSTGTIPRPDSRFRDLQTLIYATALEEIHDIKVAGIIWNYIHTKPPHMPRLLQRGGLSVANQVTTRELVLRAIKKHKLEKKPYLPFLRKVEASERNVMFQRYTLPISPSEQVLLRDYVHSVGDIEAALGDKDFVPIRNIERHCDWCGYKKLCQAVILGGDTDALVRKHFKHDTRKKGGEKKHGKEDDEIQTLLEEAS